MEFDEMQIIWNEQNNEKLYAINEAGLHAIIRQKGRKIGRTLAIGDWLMVVVNIAAAIFLYWKLGESSTPFWQNLLSGLYFAYGVSAFGWRLLRRQQQKTFPATMLGDLDKALWHADHLIRVNSRLLWLYLIPVCVVATVFLVVNGEWMMALAMNVVLPTGGYYASRWENRKWHEPKMRELEDLRDKLLAEE